MNTAENDTKAQAAAILEQQLEATYPNFDADMRRSLASMGASIATREAAEVKATPDKLPTVAKILQFPLPFDEDTRAVSNSLARGSLFAAVKERQFFKQYCLVGEVQGVKVEFKGEQLNQDDHDTLLQLIAMANHKAFGVDICQTVNAVLRGIGRTTHQEQRRQLFDQISRLVSGTIRLTSPNTRYEGHLLDDASTPHDQAELPQHRRHITYRLNPKFARLYAESSFTLFDTQERSRLKGRGSELAKWLHLWIIGNAEQYPHKVETIRELCGSNTRDLKEFRRQLRRALDLLKEAGIITAWQIDPRPATETGGDLVTIEHIPSESQQKHITQKASRKPRK